MALGSISPDSFSRWDGEFHLMIAQASGNPLLLSVYRQINQVRLHAQWDAMKEKVLTPDVIIDTTGSIVASTTP